MTWLICLVLLATSCRRLPYAPPTVHPSITPTPRSTALPPIATPIPVGSSDNPLHLKFVALPDIATPQVSDSAATAEATAQPEASAAANDLEKALLDETHLAISVEVVQSDAEGLAAVCASPKGTASAAWLSGLAYAAAYAQGCGGAAAQITHGSASSATTGDQARIIVNATAGIGAIGDLAKHTFCRLGYSDIFSWLIPSLMIHQGGVADSDLKSITDYSDPKTLIDDVAAGTCDAAGISGSQFDDLASASARTSVHMLQQSALIPYAVLVIPPELPLAQQQALSAALVAISNGSHADSLKALLVQDQVVAASDDDFSNMRSFISGLGIDLAQAGN